MALKVIRYDPEDTYNLKAAVAILQGQLGGITTDGRAGLADVDATPSATLCNEALGVAVADAAAGEPVALAPIAVVEGFSGLTVGAKQWLSATAGGITETRPTTAGHIIQAVGRARSASEVKFNVAPAVVKAQAAATTDVAGI